jgi:putative ABC transport system substrate-binding protein
MTKISRIAFVWFRPHNRKSKIENPKWVQIFTIVFIFAFGGVVAQAQQARKVPRIVYVVGRSRPMELDEAFRQGLRELGYIEGQNIIVEYRWGAGEEKSLPNLFAEVTQHNPDLIVTGTTPWVLAAKSAIRTIPIVMTNSSDAVRDGLVASLARPGGNVTGVSIFLPELSGKRLELLKETLPKLSRVATIWNAANPGNTPLLRDIEAAARELKLQTQSLGIRSPDDLEGAFATIARNKAGALNVLSDSFISNNRALITGLALKGRLPSIFPSNVYVQSGGLMSYGPHLADSYRRAATYVDKILKGAKPADLPVEQPTKFEFIVNLKTAKQIGLTIPPNVLARADRVIK